MAKKKTETTEEMSFVGDFPSLNSLLQKNDKRGLFKHSAFSVGFPTGFYQLDYRNGYVTNIYDNDDNVIGKYNNVGLFGGTFNTIIGKTGTAKTTLAAQMAANISNYCLNKYKIPAEIYHIDAEQASNYTRIKNITGLSINHLKSIYHITRETTYIEDIYDGIENLVTLKEKYRDTFVVDSGLLDEFGEPIKMFIPTIIIIDSLPSIATKEGKSDDGIEGGLKTGTYANRLAKAISRFYKQCMPLINKYNLIVIVINHINAKIEIGGMPTSPQTMYLKMNESVPGGAAPLYYAHNLFKIVMDKKLLLEKNDVVDGFVARIELLKSRSNKAGKSCKLIYDQDTGFDPYLSLYDYINEQGGIGGRNPSRYIIGFTDTKFDDRCLKEYLKNNDELKKLLVNIGTSYLEKILSSSKFNDTTPSADDIQNLYDNINESYSDESE
jgi:RecA/RadA recombinase